MPAQAGIQATLDEYVARCASVDSRLRGNDASVSDGGQTIWTYCAPRPRRSPASRHETLQILGAARSCTRREPREKTVAGPDRCARAGPNRPSPDWGFARWSAADQCAYIAVSSQRAIRSLALQFRAQAPGRRSVGSWRRCPSGRSSTGHPPAQEAAGTGGTSLVDVACRGSVRERVGQQLDGRACDRRPRPHQERRHRDAVGGSL